MHTLSSLFSFLCARWFCVLLAGDPPGLWALQPSIWAGPRGWVCGAEPGHHQGSAEEGSRGPPGLLWGPETQPLFLTRVLQPSQSLQLPAPVQECREGPQSRWAVSSNRQPFTTRSFVPGGLPLCVSQCVSCWIEFLSPMCARYCTETRSEVNFRHRLAYHLISVQTGHILSLSITHSLSHNMHHRLWRLVYRLRPPAAVTPRDRQRLGLKTFSLFVLGVKITGQYLEVKTPN